MGLLLEVGRLEALVGRGPLARVVHEQEVEEAEAGRAQPGKLVLQVVVRLRLECEFCGADFLVGWFCSLCIPLFS